SSFFYQAEAGIRDGHVTGVQTCALPIPRHSPLSTASSQARPPSGPPAVRHRRRTRLAARGGERGVAGGGGLRMTRARTRIPARVERERGGEGKVAEVGWGRVV